MYYAVFVFYLHLTDVLVDYHGNPIEKVTLFSMILQMFTNLDRTYKRISPQNFSESLRHD